MTARRARVRAAAALAVILLASSACGDGADPDAGAGVAATSQGRTSSAADLGSPGEDQLDSSRWGARFSAAGETSWQFPQSYETTGDVPNRVATAEDGDALYKIEIGASPGTDRLERVVRDARDEAVRRGQTTEVQTTYIGGRQFHVLTQEAGSGSESARNYFHAPADGGPILLVRFTTNAPLDDTPQQRLDELHQTVHSLWTG